MMDLDLDVHAACKNNKLCMHMWSDNNQMRLSHVQNMTLVEVVMKMMRICGLKGGCTMVSHYVCKLHNSELRLMYV